MRLSGMTVGKHRRDNCVRGLPAPYIAVGTYEFVGLEVVDAARFKAVLAADAQQCLVSGFRGRERAATPDRAVLPGVGQRISDPDLTG